MTNHRISKLQRVRNRFYYYEQSSTPDIKDYGTYRMGLTADEIKDYLRVRADKLAVAKLYKKFCNIAGCNTGSMAPTGEFLMYRHDVERFADKLFLGKETYFD